MRQNAVPILIGILFNIDERVIFFLCLGVLKFAGFLNESSERNLTIAALLIFTIPNAYAANITWSGNVDNKWDTSTLNWEITPNSSVAFEDGDVTIFNKDRTQTIELVGDLRPALIYVSSDNYTFDGVGSITSATEGYYFQIVGSNTSVTLNNETANTFAYVDIGENTSLTVKRTDLLGISVSYNDIDNAGTLNFDIATDGTFGCGIQGRGNITKSGTGTLTLTENNTYTGTTTITSGTLVAQNVNAPGDSAVVNNSKLQLDIASGGEFSNDITGSGVVEVRQKIKFTGNIAANMIIADGGGITDTDITIASGKTFDVTAVTNAADAAFQGGTLTIASGGTLKTTFTDYGVSIGQKKTVYIGSDMNDDGFTNNGNAVTIDTNSLYKIVDGLKLEGGKLFYILQRLNVSDLYLGLTPGISKPIDDYHGGNDFLETIMETGDLSTTQKAVALQSAFDIANQTAPMSALYNTKLGIGNAIYIRTQIVPGYFGTHYRGQSCNTSIKREAWAAPIYGNSKGFRLNSGNFRYGHVNDQYAMAFGVDTVDDGMRLGIMGLGGWGKARSSGELLTTWNESNFGGAYIYANTRRGNTDYLFTAGYLGMDNDFEQVNLGGNLTGKMSSGLATLTKTYCLGEMHMDPVFGVEYGYMFSEHYHEHYGSTMARWAF